MIRCPIGVRASRSQDLALLEPDSCRRWYLRGDRFQGPGFPCIIGCAGIEDRMGTIHAPERFVWTLCSALRPQEGRLEQDPFDGVQQRAGNPRFDLVCGCQRDDWKLQEGTSHLCLLRCWVSSIFFGGT